MSFEVPYTAWDNDSGAPATGDGGNHTITVRVAGSDVTGLTPVEQGSGRYHVVLTDSQLPEGAQFSLRGTSSTSNVTIHGGWGVRPETMRGTDGAYTGTPPTPAQIESEIAAQHGAGSYQTATGFATPGDQMALEDGAITAAKIAQDAIGSTQFADSAVTKIESALINEGDGQQLIDAIVQAIDDADISTNLTVAMVRDGILNRVLPGNHDSTDSVGAFLQRLDDAITSRSSHNPAAVRTELEGSGTKLTEVHDRATEARLAKLDVSGTLAHSDDASTYQADLTTLNDPTAVAIRQEIDSNSTQLAAIPKEGETHRYRRIAEDENNQSADVTIESP